MTVTNIQKSQEGKLFIILFLISILLSYIGIFGIHDPTIMPNYFIALVVSFILTKKAKLNLNKLVIIGVVTDILAGQLIGQYGLIFINIYIAYLITNKILVIKYEKQIESLSILLILFGFLILWLTSQSYGISIAIEAILFQSILTFIAYLFFRVIIKTYL